MNKTYQCAMCMGIFDFSDDWTDKDARKEAIENGFDPDAEDNEIVCDDCYQRMNSQVPIKDFF
jgi:DNA-directed RNA polymerase subunit RPC12/RpoP